MKELSQTDMILFHLKEHGGITSWEAIREYGCTRLSDKIYRLRKMGYCIENKPVFRKNRYGKPVQFVRYILKEKEEMSLWEKIRMWM